MSPVEKAARVLYEFVGTETPELEADGIDPMTIRRLEARAAFESIDVDELAQEIRRVDGNHDMGAGALAEAVKAWLLGEEK